MNFPHFSADESGDALVITFHDRYVNEQSVEAMRSDMLRNIEHRRKIVLCLENVEFLGSATLGLIAQVGRKVSSSGGRMVLCAVRPEVARLFSGPPYLIRNFPTYAGRGEALHALANGGA